MVSLWQDAAMEVVCLTTRDETALLIQLFETVAQEQGWQPGAALDEWTSHSVYFALQNTKQDTKRNSAFDDTFDKRKILLETPFIGGLQLALPDAAGHLPCAEVWPEVVTPPRSAHIAILALETKWRGPSRFFWSLAVEMWRYGVATGLTTFYLEVTPRVLPLYQRLGWPLEQVGELRLHWGEPCYLCTLGIPEVAQSLLHKAESSPYYRQIIAQAFRVTLAESRDQEPGREVFPPALKVA